MLSEDGEFVFSRPWCGEAHRQAVPALYTAADQQRPAVLDRPAQEYALKDGVDSAWAVRLLELVHERGRQLLLLEDPGGQALERLLDGTMEPGMFLRLAFVIAAVLTDTIPFSAADPMERLHTPTARKALSRDERDPHRAKQLEEV